MTRLFFFLVLVTQLCLHLGYFSARHSQRTSSVTQLGLSLMLGPADLTPAVDKFVRQPSVPREQADMPYFMTAKGPTPDGPEPFGLVSDELQPLSDYVKELVVSENPVLTMAAQHFFDQVWG